MKLSGRRVLVTGAGGFIGSHLCEVLVAEGARVRALLRYTSRSDLGPLADLPPAPRREIEVVWGDLRDEVSVRRALGDCRVVFHLGAVTSVAYSYESPGEFAATNVMGTTNVLTAARDAGVERFVHTSTSEVYGTARYVPIDEGHPLQAQSPYAASKIAADKMAESFLRTYGLPVVVLRPFNTYGPRQSGRAIVPSPKRDLTYVKDTVRGFLRAAEEGAAVGQTINLGTGQMWSVEELVGMIEGVIGRRVEIVAEEQRKRPESSEVLELLCDNHKAKRLLGWGPAFTPHQGLDDTARWIREHLDRFRDGSTACERAVSMTGREAFG